MMGLSFPTGRDYYPLLFQTVSRQASLAHNIMKKQVLSVISYYECYVFHVSMDHFASPLSRSWMWFGADNKRRFL